MYYTHHFAHHETLRRACEWLDHMGFHPECTTEPDVTPRLSMPVSVSQLAKVEMVISAVEKTDPQGWPSFWDEARLTHSAPRPVPSSDKVERRSSRPAAIGWHPIDRTGLSAWPEFEQMYEAMGH
jgi:hypothetical protein